MDSKEYDKEAYKKNYPSRALENVTMVPLSVKKVQTKAYQEYQAKLRKEKEETQKSYNDILAGQQRFKTEMTSRYGTMTENERRMNQRDLMVLFCAKSLVIPIICSVNVCHDTGN